jgi:hypothetical protein
MTKKMPCILLAPGGWSEKYNAKWCTITNAYALGYPHTSVVWKVVKSSSGISAITTTTGVSTTTTSANNIATNQTATTATARSRTEIHGVP